MARIHLNPSLQTRNMTGNAFDSLFLLIKKHTLKFQVTESSSASDP